PDVANDMAARSRDLYASIARVSISGLMPRIVGIPPLPPSRRWQDAHIAASWAPASRSAALLRSARIMNDPAAIEAAMILRILRPAPSRYLLSPIPLLMARRAWQHHYDII